ncbi:MAG: HAMP domain-containing protein [Solirubrobacteraceae bacterium]
MVEIAEGDAEHDVDVRSRDEFGRLGGAFDRMGAYLRDSAGVADRIADGDLTVEPRPHSDRDVLGSALLAMVQRLRDLVGRVSGSATTLTSASQEMPTTRRTPPHTRRGCPRRVCEGSRRRPRPCGRCPRRYGRTT